MYPQESSGGLSGARGLSEFTPREHARCLEVGLELAMCEAAGRFIDGIEGGLPLTITKLLLHASE